MKTRIGFVSNSSSSSFVIDKDKISDYQRRLIYDHSGKAEGDAWSIFETDHAIHGSCFMDNFNMLEWLVNICEIKSEYIEWEY